MSICGNCGNTVAEGKKFCGSCGAVMNAPGPGPEKTPPAHSAPPPAIQSGLDSLKSAAENAADYTGDIDPADIRQNKAMGGLAYFLFFLPLITCPESKYGRFHSNQGLLYLILCIAGSVANTGISAILLALNWRLYLLTAIISLVIWIPIIALGVLGLINGFSGKAKELPVIGRIRIIK